MSLHAEAEEAGMAKQAASRVRDGDCMKEKYRIVFQDWLNKPLPA